MNLRNVLNNFVLPIIMTMVFSFISVYLPSSLVGLVFMGYFIVFMTVYAVFAGMQFKRILKDLEYVSDGITLFEESKEKVFQIKSRDKELLEESRLEIKKASPRLLIFFAILLFIILVSYVNQVRYYIIILPCEYLKGVLLDEKLARFIVYLLFYCFLYIIQLIAFRRSGTPSLRLTSFIPSQYKITDRGMILDNSYALKFPLEVTEFKVNKSRKFVEFTLKSKGSTSQIISGKVRLYSSRIEELAKILKRYLKTVE